MDTELAERSARLARVEERVRGIITMQLDGDRSPVLAEMRRDFEAQAVTERVAVAALQSRSTQPIRLPNVAELTQRVQSLDALTRSEHVDAAREALRSYLKGGTIVCTPEEGRYIARAELLPIVAMLGPEMPNAAELESRAALSSSGCAGRI